MAAARSSPAANGCFDAVTPILQWKLTLDNDSSNGGPTANVDLPASRPFIVGCGGTTKATKADHVGITFNPSGNGAGRGFSTIFPPQPWHAGAPHGPPNDARRRGQRR